MTYLYPHGSLTLSSVSLLPIQSLPPAISIINSIILEKIWNVALETGANVLALNILEAEASSDKANSRRNTLNEKILNHKQER